MRHMGILEREPVETYDMDPGLAFCTMLPASIREVLRSHGIHSPDQFHIPDDSSDIFETCRQEWGPSLSFTKCWMTIENCIFNSLVEVLSVPGISATKLKILKLPSPNVVDQLVNNDACKAIQWGMNVETSMEQEEGVNRPTDVLLKAYKPDKFGHVHIRTFSFQESMQEFRFGTTSQDQDIVTAGFKLTLMNAFGEETDYQQGHVDADIPWRIYFLATRGMGGYQAPHVDFTTKNVQTQSTTRRRSSEEEGPWNMDMPLTKEGSSINIWVPPYSLENDPKEPIKIDLQHGEILLRAGDLIHGGNLLGSQGGAAWRFHGALALRKKHLAELVDRAKTERKDANGQEIVRLCTTPDSQMYKVNEATLIKMRQARLQSMAAAAEGEQARQEHRELDRQQRRR